MARTIEPGALAVHTPRWTIKRTWLLWTLLGVVAIGAVGLMPRGRDRTQELAGLDVSHLRIAAMQNPRDPDIAMALTESYLWDERIEDALRAAQRAVELAPGSSRAHYLLGKAYQRNAQAAAGLKALERAIELDPSNAPARFLLGHGYYNYQQRPLPAAQQFEKYVEMQPADDIGFRFLGMAWTHLGKLGPAEGALRRAIELGPDTSGNHEALGAFYLARASGQEDLERAVQEFTRTLELFPRSRNTRIQLGMALMRLNRLPEAASNYEAALSDAPGDANVCYALLRIYTRLHDAPRIARYTEQYRRIKRAQEAGAALKATAAESATGPTG